MYRPEQLAERAPQVVEPHHGEGVVAPRVVERGREA